ncbi:ABC transporter permease [uncultured Imperialibacter sp.]|uniref:ABC transporter permease n=1 Tax=uncultured Imperialibacter sp. TaxID=1672639 RepID=UPI0030DD6080|tara:strand:- start:37191 stop:39551 length:2361 start_codon:yes stop_codon:yes gene_type:complete
MVKNYFTIALRVLRRDRLFSIVNILGLSVGLTTVLFIFLWVKDEISFDKFHEEIENIYYVYEHQEYSNGQSFYSYVTPGPLAPALLERYSEIEGAVRFTWANFTVKVGDVLVNEDQVYMTDQSFFDVFSFRVLRGKRETLLTDPSSIVITRDLAIKYFGSDWEQQDVVGQAIRLDDKWNVAVSGVVENPPRQSGLQFHAVVPFHFLADRWGSWIETDWGSNALRTYVKLANGANAEALADALRYEVETHNEGSNVELFLLPFAELHLTALNGKNDPKTYLRIFVVAAIFILLIACINFTNLATARAMKRAKEIGVRKSIGAMRNQLIGQYLMESLVLALVSSIVAVGLAAVLLPWFNQASGKQLLWTDVDAIFVAGLAIIVGFTGIFAGIYPAFYLSSFKPVEVLKGTVKLQGGLFRKALVILQFTLSTVLILSTVVVNRQLSFMKSKDLGYKLENVIYLEMKGDPQPGYKALQANANRFPEILSLTVADQVPINGGYSTSNMDWEGKDPESDVNVYFINTGYDYLQTLGIDLAAGRTHSREFSTDTMNVVINEAMAELIGRSPDELVGERFRLWKNEGKIIGVAKNYHFEKMNAKISPQVISLSPRRSNNVMVRISGANLQQSLASVRTIWEEAVPDQPFDYSFMDQEFNEVYEKETQVSQLFTSFSVIAILISCIGLFGLASFVAAQMRREIGLRKVLGATMQQIVFAFSKRFLGWVIVANIIGLPVGYWLMNLWLEEYAYRITVQPTMLAAVALLTLGITLTTILHQSISSAATNPADVLRHE